MTDVVDIHCHMFNASDLPIRGFIKYVGLHGDPVSGPLADLADWILSEGTVSCADDLARLDILLAPPAPNPQPLLVPIPQAGLVHPTDRIDTVAAAKLNQLQLQRPDLVGRVGNAMAAMGAGPVSPAAPGTDELTQLFDVGTVLRAVRWASLFTRSRLDLAADYAKTFNNQISLAVPLLVDLGTNLGDRPATPVIEQIQVFEKLSRASMLGVLPNVGGMHIHPFIGFDPWRELADRKTNAPQTALELAKIAIDTYGFIGVKVYPPMGFQPSGNQARPGVTQADADELNQIMRDLAEWCQAEEVPITAHGNRSNYASPAYEALGMGSPQQWVGLLKGYPALRLNLGHCGGAHVDPAGDAWPNAIRAAMRTYSTLFGDIGDFRLDEADIVKAFRSYLQTAVQGGDTTIASRLMFGSDWYLLALNPGVDTFLSTATRLATDVFGAGSVNDFLAANALRFLGFDDANNKNAKRLCARYQKYQAPRPAWLSCDS